MAKPSKVDTTVGAAQTKFQVNNAPESMPVIYADRVINAGFGPGVSRLTLAMEMGIGTFTPSAILILPTPALLEAVSVVLNAFQGNDEIRDGVIKGLEAIKTQLNSLKK